MKITGRAVLCRMSVSVIMAACNEENYIEEALSSILSQTHRDIKVIVVNDASTDRTGEILEGIADDRVRVFRFAENRGAAFALNYAAELSEGNWIAVHDADDISYHGRIERQLEYLRKNPHLVALGTFVECFTGPPDPVPEQELRLEEAYKNRVRTPEEIRSTLFCYCPLTHGSVMFSREAFQAAGGYDSRLRIAYDYDLWTRMVNVGPVENLPQKLYRYRRHEGALSRKWLETSRELFYSFSRYLRSSCFSHLERPPVLAVTGNKKAALNFVRQAEGIIRAVPVYQANRENLSEIIRYYHSRRLDGAVVLNTLPGAAHVFRWLAENGMAFNENLFMFASLV